MMQRMILIQVFENFEVFIDEKNVFLHCFKSLRKPLAQHVRMRGEMLEVALHLLS